MTTRTAFLMPVYNPDPARLRRTLASMRDQRVPADIVVVDDGSHPPLDILIDDPDVTILRLPANQGIVAALNRGLTHILADGYEFVARMDCGDLCRPDRIAVQQAAMDARPELDLLGCHAEIVDEAGRILFDEGTSGGEAAIRRKLFDNAAFKHPAFFLRARSVERLGTYSGRYRHAEDYELARRYAARGRVDCLDDVLIVYEKSPTGLSETHRGAQLRARLGAQLRWFEPRAAHAYLGVLRTVVTMLVPPQFWARLSRLYWRGRNRRTQTALSAGNP